MGEMWNCNPDKTRYRSLDGRASDKHINFAQLLLKLEFPDVDGFRNTLINYSKASMLKSMFIIKCHWACILCQ